LLALVPLLVSAAPAATWASEVSIGSAAENTSDNPEGLEEQEAPSGENAKKKFWLTDPAMIEKAPVASALMRTFPLGKEMAGDKALPRPLGVALSAYWQKQDYDISSAVIDVGGLPTPL